jgi:hypothetical protein
MCIRWWN